jgi:hypothetical protein
MTAASASATEAERRAKCVSPPSTAGYTFMHYGIRCDERMPLAEQRPKPGSIDHRIDEMPPPSTRRAAPVVADACGEATYTTRNACGPGSCHTGLAGDGDHAAPIRREHARHIVPREAHGAHDVDLKHTILRDRIWIIAKLTKRLLRPAFDEALDVFPVTFNRPLRPTSANERRPIALTASRGACAAAIGATPTRFLRSSA